MKGETTFHQVLDVEIKDGALQIFCTLDVNHECDVILCVGDIEFIIGFGLPIDDIREARAASAPNTEAEKLSLLPKAFFLAEDLFDGTFRQNDGCICNGGFHGYAVMPFFWR